MVFLICPLKTGKLHILEDEKIAGRSQSVIELKHDLIAAGKGKFTLPPRQFEFPALLSQKRITFSGC